MSTLLSNEALRAWNTYMKLSGGKGPPGASDTVTPSLRRALDRAARSGRPLSKDAARVVRELRAVLAGDELSSERHKQVRDKFKGKLAHEDNVNALALVMRESIEWLRERVPDLVPEFQKMLHSLGEIDGENAEDEYEEDVERDSTSVQQGFRGVEHSNTAEDTPEPFAGMPVPGGTMVPDRRRGAHDSNPLSFDSMFPDAARIKVGPNYKNTRRDAW